MVAGLNTRYWRASLRGACQGTARQLCPGVGGFEEFYVSCDNDPACPPLPDTLWALDGRAVMSHVEFKKWLCRMSLSLIFFKVTC